MKGNECKYIWTTKEFDEWVKKQTDIARKRGIRTSSAGVTHILMKDIIKPNNLFDIIPKPKKIRIRRRKLI